MILLFYLLLQEETVEALIERLGSDSVQVRERAGDRLRERAVEAEEALEQATRSADAEVAARAGEILELLVGYRREVARTLPLLLKDARTEFDEGHFAHCVRLCDLALQVAPDFGPVEELRRDALAGCWRPGHGELVQAIELRRIRLPTLDVWRALKGRIPNDVPDDEWGEVSPNRKLATMKIDLAFEETSLDDILAFIRDFSGLNLVLDARLHGMIDPARKLDFKVKDRTLGQTLRCLLAEFGLTYVITEQRVVLLTR